MKSLIPFLSLLASAAVAEVSFEKKQLSDKFYGEGVSVGDFNQDGNPDIVNGPFWYEGPAFEKSHEIYPAKAFEPKGYSNNFQTFAGDINADGADDVLIVTYPGKEAVWYENPGKGTGEWKGHMALTPVNNESPLFLDITGDGRPELICSVDGFYGYAGPDPKRPELPWIFHRITPQIAGHKFGGSKRTDRMDGRAGWGIASSSPARAGPTCSPTISTATVTTTYSLPPTATGTASPGSSR